MNVLIVEDEKHTAELLKEIIEQNDDFMVTEIAESVAEAVSYLSKYQKKLDLLFFDIQLADGPSFEIFKHIDVVLPVVFCTAYDEFSLQAIRNNGIDYILKPFKEAEIQNALNKYRHLLQTLGSKNAKPIELETEKSSRYQQRFLTQFRNKTIVINTDDIALFHVENETVYLYTFDGKKHPLFKKLEYIEGVCHPGKFFRINRQMLVSRQAILSIEPYFNRKVVLQLKSALTEKAIVSRLKVTAFKEWLEGNGTEE